MGTYIFCHIFCDNGDVRLCKNSTFSFQDINQKLNQKLLSCFIARFLVWQYCSFAPVQKNQNPSGASDCPGPQTASQGRPVQPRLTGIVLRFCSDDFLAFRTAAHTPHIYAVGSLKSGPFLRELIAPILQFSIPKNHRNPTACNRILSFYTV